MSGRRTTYNAGPAAYYAGTPQTEAAKHLGNVCRRFVADKANASDVEKAIGMWFASCPCTNLPRCQLGDGMHAAACPRAGYDDAARKEKP